MAAKAPVKVNANDNIIVICGAPGAGKSSLIEQLTNRTGLANHGLTSANFEIHCSRVQRNGQSIVFVEFPGFDQDHRTDNEILSVIAQWLKDSYRDKAFLRGIVFLHRITDHPKGETFKRNLHMLIGICGQNCLGKVAIVTTMWDNIDENQGDQRQDELKGSGWQPLIAGNAQLTKFKPPSEQKAWSVVDALLSRPRPEDEPKGILLQAEIADQNKRLQATTAGQAVYHDLQGVIQKVHLKQAGAAKTSWGRRIFGRMFGSSR